METGTMEKNKQVLLKSRPKGWVSEADFELAEAPIPQPGEGQVLVRNHWLSLDPYMRGRMNDTKSYSAKAEIGEVMVGGTVGEVIETRDPSLKKGDFVVGMLGWQQYGAAPAKAFRAIDTKAVPAQAYLGVVGMPGVTAWVGLLTIAEPKPGETVVVSAASGAVGSVVGQIAKIRGARAVGIAGGPEKCRYLVEELSFDAGIDYKSSSFVRDLEAATPKGVDVYFENVGGDVLEAVSRRFNPFARMPLCGLVSQYNETNPVGLRNLHSFLVNRVKLQGFIVSDKPELWPRALQELASWVASGKIKYRETVAQGLENASKAFIGMLKGENFGKQLVKLV
ncbi:MAG: NADP-dependent oxidoreductase [Hyphomicrobiales bacterium]|nr:NADP-dependent oxidoreductase [Hyphomicrobiales bacterium]